MIKLLGLFFFSLLASPTVLAAYVERFTEPEKFVQAHRLAGDAEPLLFQMAYAAQPICKTSRGSWDWSFGPWSVGIPKNPSANDKEKTIHEYLVQKYQATPGARIFLGGLDETPMGYAGFKVGVPYETEMTLDELKVFLNAGPLQEAPKRLDVQEKKFGANPWDEFVIRQNGESKQVKVKRVSACRSSLQVNNSEYLYAESKQTAVILSYPLLQRLSRSELVAVLSHEIAQVALSLSWREGPSSTVDLLAPIVFGELRELRINRETNTVRPDQEELIQADRLAMRIAYGMGLSVSSYVNIMSRLVDDGSPGKPSYDRTRPIKREREADLKRAVELWKSSQQFLPVSGVSEEVLSGVLERANLVRKNPAYVFSDGTENVLTGKYSDGYQEYAANQLPKSESRTKAVAELPSTTVSSVERMEDLSAIPFVNEVARNDYQRWLTLKQPRAFAISVLGAYAWASGANPTDATLPTSPAERALVLCNRKGSTPCRLYAVDRTVVWTGPTEDEMKELVAPVSHSAEVPSSTGFAAVDDVEAVPKLSSKGKELYQEWLSKPFPRAVAVSAKGAMARGYGAEAMRNAVRNCEKLASSPCRLYAVDDQVVWKAE